MIFSDLYLTKDLKIELLPTDRFQEKKDFLEDGDRIIVVFRPVRTSVCAGNLITIIFDEIHSRKTQNKLSLTDSLTDAVRACNVSALNFLGNPEDAPESGAMVLITYIDASNIVTIFQIGTIKAKHRKSDKFVEITADHSFGNPVEIENLDTNNNAKEIYKNVTTEKLIELIAHTEKFIKETDELDYSKIPSRFICHPSWCGWGNEYGESAISTKPYIFTIS